MNTDLTTALQNAGYKLIDNVRYRDGKWQKRGVVWMPLAQCPALPERYFGLVENKGGVSNRVWRSVYNIKL